MRWLFAVTALLLVSSAQGSILADLQKDLGLYDPGTETETELVHLEHDFLVAGDAPDSCAAADGYRSLGTQSSSHATLTDINDLMDVTHINVQPEDLGQRVNIQVLLDDLYPAFIQPGFDFAVYTTSCSEDITDPGASYYDQYDENLEAGLGEVVQSADLSGGDCGGPWRVLLNHNGHFEWRAGQALFKWTNGDHEYVDVERENQGTVRWSTTTNPDVTLASVEVVVPEGFDKQLQLVNGYCDAQEGTVDLAGHGSNTAGYFTPLTQETEYILAVFLTNDPVARVVESLSSGDLTGGGLAGLAANALLLEAPAIDPLQPIVINTSCHTDICLPVGSALDFDLIMSN